ncbi:hypothetical protein EIN_151300 [Entamoeba invadens IP1]|uniref:Uncharacterized protein n=1 Tax=Entamoeba invadens IP1 TaxID=370355 RepID=A0A0A1UBZ8_ENTIV|nr:hypothetical protein EIN_151300 [Entamoeba invadens IP1]ELP91233.1 hypothetical protein EIN_151300 [Entamoeba invadens IP1]|eukprot:XP_004258004.1 hypothetical protein EIN_151300 [Entamoeba invadens IP1]
MIKETVERLLQNTITTPFRVNENESPDTVISEGQNYIKQIHKSEKNRFELMKIVADTQDELDDMCELMEEVMNKCKEQGSTVAKLNNEVITIMAAQEEKRFNEEMKIGAFRKKRLARQHTRRQSFFDKQMIKTDGFLTESFFAEDQPYQWDLFVKNEAEKSDEIEFDKFEKVEKIEQPVKVDTEPKNEGRAEPKPDMKEKAVLNLPPILVRQNKDLTDLKDLKSLKEGKENKELTQLPNLKDVNLIAKDEDIKVLETDKLKLFEKPIEKLNDLPLEKPIEKVEKGEKQEKDNLMEDSTEEVVKSSNTLLSPEMSQEMKSEMLHDDTLLDDKTLDDKSPNKTMKKTRKSRKDKSDKGKKEEYHVLNKIFLGKDDVEKIEEWSGKKVDQVLFDSNVDSYTKTSNEFVDAVMDQSDIAIVVEDTNGNRFGGYIHAKIDVIGAWVDDQNAFVFSLFSNGRMKEPQKFELKANKQGRVFWVSKPTEACLFVVGNNDIRVAKKHSKRDYCLQSTFEYKGNTRALSGSSYPEKFNTKQFVVIKFK